MWFVHSDHVAPCALGKCHGPWEAGPLPGGPVQFGRAGVWDVAAREARSCWRGLEWRPALPGAKHVLGPFRPFLSHRAADSRPRCWMVRGVLSSASWDVSAAGAEGPPRRAKQGGRAGPGKGGSVQGAGHTPRPRMTLGVRQHGEALCTEAFGERLEAAWGASQLTGARGGDGPHRSGGRGRENWGLLPGLRQPVTAAGRPACSAGLAGPWNLTSAEA